MRAFGFAICLAACIGVAGCADAPRRAAPGPELDRDPWDPATAIREHLPRSASGEVLFDASNGLSPDEAAILAIAQHPQLRVARAERGIGEAQLLAAGLLPNPSVGMLLGFPATGPDASVLGYGFGVSWDLWSLVSRSAKVAAATENLAVIDLEIAWQEWQVAQAARLHTFRCIYLTRQLQLAEEIENVAHRVLLAIRESGMSATTGTEEAAAARSHATAQFHRREMQQALAAEQIHLRAALGVDPGSEIVIDTGYLLQTSQIDDPALLDGITRKRLDLVALQHLHRQHDAAARVAASAWFAPFNIGLETNRDVDRAGGIGPAVSFQLPFFDRGQANVARERATQIQIEAQYDARLLQARADVMRVKEEIRIASARARDSQEDADAAATIAGAAQDALATGALDLVQAAALIASANASRTRSLQVESVLAELQVALALASGQYR